MKASAIAALLLLTSAIAAQAALPPHYQRQKELFAILQNPAIVEVFGIGRPLTGIVMTGTDLFEVTSEDCHMDVRILDVPRTQNDGFVGPRNFVVEAGPLICD